MKEEQIRKEMVRFISQLVFDYKSNKMSEEQAWRLLNILRKDVNPLTS